MKTMKHHQQQHNPFINYIAHSTDGEFTLMVNSPIHIKKTAPPGFQYKNRLTEELCGKEVILRKHLCDGLTILDEPWIDEDIYDLVEE